MRSCYPLLGLAFLMTLSSCALQLAAPQTTAIPVITEGSAPDCETALKQAKVLAADTVAGTFVHGQRTLSQDRDYSESLNEYTSGVVVRHTLLEKSGTRPCKVKIEAWVTPGRGKVELNQAPNRVGVEDINHRARQLQNNQQFLARHLRDTKDFDVRFSQQETLDTEPGRISVSLLVTEVRPPQRWLTDLEAFLSIHGQPVIYQQDSRINALSRIFKLERSGTKPSPAPWDFEICFPDQSQKEVRCYTGEINRKIIRVLRSSAIDLELKWPGVHGNAVTYGPFGFTFYAFKPFGMRYVAPGYEPRTDFPVIEAAVMPLRIGFDYAGRQLPKDATLTGRARFSDINQFPLNERQP